MKIKNDNIVKQKCNIKLETRRDCVRYGSNSKIKKTERTFFDFIQKKENNMMISKKMTFCKDKNPARESKNFVLPWKCTADFDKLNHLFTKKIETGYIVEIYICRCGKITFITKHLYQDFQYLCSVCKNKTFYSANLAWSNIEIFLLRNSKLSIKYLYDIQKTDDVVKSICFIRIPKYIDYITKKIAFEKKIIYYLSLTYSGKLEEYYLLEYNHEVFARLKQNLKNYIRENRLFPEIPLCNKKNITIEDLAFFLKNRNLKSYDLIYWKNIKQFENLKNVTLNTAFNNILKGKKGKYLKKLIYKNFLYQIEYSNFFNDSLIKIFTKKIDDINILAQLIKLDIYSYNFVFNYEDIEIFVDFLKNYYSEIQILTFFKKCEKKTLYPMLFDDMIREFIFCKPHLKNKFKKIKCDVEVFHNEFAKISRKERYKDIFDKDFSYNNDVMKKCVKIANYTVKLPLKGEELFIWSDKLKNCLASYFYKIQNHKSLIFGFFIENSIKFAIEIQNNQIIQASAKYNKNLTERESEVLNLWYKKFREC